MKVVFDKDTFFSNFAGLEELAFQTIQSFVDSLPELRQAVEKAVRNKSPEALELSAHTLKGAISNFYAEPSRLLAYQLEMKGKAKDLAEAEHILAKLDDEADALQKELLTVLTERKHV